MQDVGSVSILKNSCWRLKICTDRLWWTTVTAHVFVFIIFCSSSSEWCAESPDMTAVPGEVADELN